MIGKRILVCLMTAAMLIMNTVVIAEDNPSYSYFMNTADDAAYVWLGDTIEGNGLDILDGQAMGITDKNDSYYNETVTLDGLSARKQYSANSIYIKIDEELCDKSDNEIMFSIVYYDFGPSEGKYYFEYHTTTGATAQITLIKPGVNPGWSVKTVVLDDIDLTAKYDNGASVRIVNGAYNAFKKVEMVNLSKLKRDNAELATTTLGLNILSEMESLGMIEAGDERFVNSNLAKPCTSYDAYDLLHTITDSKATNPYSRTDTMTQGELLDIYLNELGIKNINGAVDAAERAGLTDSEDLFYADSAKATYYNLINLAHAALVYENQNGDSLMKKLILNGHFDDKELAEIKSDSFQEIYFSIPRKIPYETITDPITKRTFKFMSIGGGTTIRGYNNVISWLPDATGFVCGTQSGFFYVYDIETQMLTYLDKCRTNGTHIPVYVCLDGWLYYPKLENGIESIWKINPKTKEKIHLIELPSEYPSTILTVTNDGRYAGLDSQDMKLNKNGEYPIVRVDFETKEIDVRYYKFDKSNILNHNQINPEYPDLIGFSHETDTSKWDFTDISDRVNIIDMSTGDITVFNQGIKTTQKPVQLATHEIWSYNGEYRYFCSWATETTEASGEMPALVRMDKDGTHRQYYVINLPLGQGNHATTNGDDTWAIVDATFVGVINLKTHQVFPIVNARAIIESKGHPYHPHGHASYVGNMVNWGHVYKDVLGIAWMDLDESFADEVADGGRYPFGTDVTRISYTGLECESAVTTKYGRECIVAAPGKSIFLDINPEIIDVDNGAVKITFDYYDNTTTPLTLTYTKGVTEINDAWKVYNKTVQISRRGTKKWKTAEIVINSGNFENIGKFESDIKIATGGLNAYISDIRVEKTGR